jgi:hypothetical protein
LADLRADLPAHAAAAPEAAPTGPLELKDLKKMFDDARTLMLEPRQDSELSRDYYDGIQLTPTEIKVLTDRKQPPIVINRIQRAVDGIMGVVSGGKSSPRALMRNPPQQGDASAPPPQQQQPGMPPQMGQPQPGQQVMGGNGGPPMAPLDAGDVASMTLRFIADTGHFEPLSMDVLENGLIEGCGAAIYEVGEDKNVICTQIRWEEFFYDPYSRRADFKDARYMGTAKWIYSDQLAALYPKTQDVMDEFSTKGVLNGQPDTTWEDRPNNGVPWVDGKRKRLMVVEMYHVHGGKWYREVFYCNEQLESGPSPYNNDQDQPDNPIEAWSAYVNRKNWRYGVVKPMRDLNDEVNMRRSKALHEINSRQLEYVSIDVPPVDGDTARKEAARPDGIIPFGLRTVPRQDVVANNVEMMNEAKAELDRMAPSPALLGRSGADASGRAQQVRQQAGITELDRVLGRYRDWKQRSFIQMWNRARQFYDGPKWVRVTGDGDAPQYIQINEPGPIDPATGQPLGPPKNHIAKMDVDIVLEDVPDTATLQQEQFNEFMAFAQANPGVIPPELLIELSAIPEKQKFLKKLRDAQQANAGAKQQADQLQMAEQQAKVAKLQGEAVKSGAAADETHANIILKQAQAGLAEVQTVNAAMDGHIKASSAAQLPPGYTLDSNNQHVPHEPPPPGPANAGTGANQLPG